MKLSALPIPAALFVPWRFTNAFGPPGHYGFDFGINEGTEVYAAQSGEVLVVDADGEANMGFGNYITLAHDLTRTASGLYKATQWTLYAHLSRAVVKPGDKVTAGQIIGYSGNTGNSTGPHLHFQVQESKAPSATRPAETSGTCIDPYPLLTNLAVDPTPPPPPPDPTPVPTPGLTLPGNLEVTATAGLFLRSGPGTNYTAFKLLPYKTKLEGIAQQGDWIKVVGWVNSSWVKNV